MTPARVRLAERLAVALGFLGMAIAVATFDWRLGLFVGSALLCASALDLRRQP